MPERDAQALWFCSSSITNLLPMGSALCAMLRHSYCVLPAKAPPMCRFRLSYTTLVLLATMLLTGCGQHKPTSAHDVLAALELAGLHPTHMMPMSFGTTNQMRYREWVIFGLPET